MSNLPRRQFIRRGARLVSTFALLPLVVEGAKAAESCTKPASESLRESLNYTDQTPDPTQPCRGCGFFTAEQNPSCGQCVIMSGPVSAQGHCDSWGAKGSS